MIPPMQPLAEFRCDPPLPATAPRGDFVQLIRCVDAGQTVGELRWYVPARDDGVAQVLHLVVAEPRRRQGIGGRLVEELKRQFRALQQLRGTPPRRLWIAVEQKTHIVGRSFLTKRGFHHIGTAKDVLRDQDLMVYVLGMD
jgi:GNAT superfamily N-acetyltransferase